MALSSKKFLKLQKKVEKRLIGKYGSANGLGQDLIVNKNSITVNEYGDRIDTFISSETCKGIVIVSTDLFQQRARDLEYNDSMVTLYIPVGVEVEDTEFIHYNFIFNSKPYDLVRKNDIGQVTNITGVVREITIKPPQ